MNKEERTLTPAELKRKSDFDKICERMEQNGYIKKDLTIGVLKANILALIIMLPFAAAALVVYSIINPVGIIDLSFGLREYLVLLISLFLLIVFHELIHGLVWGSFAENHFKVIRFGVIWKALTPYCTCAESLKKWQYIIGAAMPTLILGFVPAVISAVIGSNLVFLLSVVMIFAGGGDFTIIMKMLRYRSWNKDVLYYDHPYECGVVVFEKSLG